MNGRQIISAIGGTVLSIPRSYATIVFSDSVGLGLLLLCLSMISPIIGLSGILGVVVAILFSRLIGYENWDNASGVLSFNSLLLSWAVAYYYPLSRLVAHPGELIVIIAVLAVTAQLLYIVLSHWTQSAFKMPSMSLSFSLLALVMWYYFARTGMLAGEIGGKPLLYQVQLSLPQYWEQYFVSLGSIFFSPYAISGIIIAIVLLLISRLGVGLSLLGWTLCFYLAQILGTDNANGMYYPGFNVVLAVMAVGGIFLLPGRTAAVIALLAGTLAFLLSVAANSTFYQYNDQHLMASGFQVPVFALPFNVVVLVVVYAMRFRLKAVSPVVNDTGVLHPEGALEHYLSRLKRFSRLGVPQFLLPVTGEWIISQGHHGKHTHRLDWAYAWDFEIEDGRGKRYADREDQTHDYYAFNKPVLASASGYVDRVVSHVVDNPQGSVDPQQSWGNYVSISHGYGLWTLYAHLKKDSITVKAGDYVNCAEKIGLVGNSGRSFVPHLHFQVQLGAEAGSKSKLSHLINYKVRQQDNYYEFVGSGIPGEGERVSPLVVSKDPAVLLGLQAESDLQFGVSRGSKSWTETWKVDLDFWGKMRVCSNDGTVLEFSVYNGIYNALGLTGRTNNALSAFALILSRLPYAERHDLQWKDTPSISVVFNRLIKNIILFSIPFSNPVRVSTNSKLVSYRPGTNQSHPDNVIVIQSTTEYRLSGILIKTHKGEIELDSSKGIRSIKLYKGKRLFLVAKRTADV